jgi:hypothetical protein
MLPYKLFHAKLIHTYHHTSIYHDVSQKHIHEELLHNLPKIELHTKLQNPTPNGHNFSPLL